MAHPTRMEMVLPGQGVGLGGQGMGILCRHLPAWLQWLATHFPQNLSWSPALVLPAWEGIYQQKAAMLGNISEVPVSP